MNNYLVNYFGTKETLLHRSLVERWHYSKTCRSQKTQHLFELIDSATGEVLGISIFGLPISKNTDKMTLELRRFVVRDECPKNTESFFLAHCLRWLRRNTQLNHIVTFADPNVGHKGTIYKATNFKYEGTGHKNCAILKYKNKLIHKRMVYQKNKLGQYVKSALKYQKLVKEGKAKWINQKPKHVYTYQLKAS